MIIIFIDNYVIIYIDSNKNLQNIKIYYYS